MNHLQATEAKIALDPAIQTRLLEPLRAVFSRRATREKCGRYISGLISKVKRKNRWQLAEALGDETPYRLQSFLGKSTWEADEAVKKRRNFISDQGQNSDNCLMINDIGLTKNE